MPAIPYGDIPRFYAERKPRDALAVIYPDGELTWWELESRANQRARLFKSLGVGEGDFVTISMPNSFLYVEAVFAAWKCGAVPNPVSWRLPAHELRAIVDLAKPRLVVGSSAEVLPDYPRVDADLDVSAFSDAPILAPVVAYARAMTSGGSTGRPKLIVSHTPTEFDPEAPNLIRNLYLIEPGMALLVPEPNYHAAGQLIFGALFMGGVSIGVARFDAEETLRLIEKHAVSWTVLVPTMMHRIWALPQEVRNAYDLSSLKIVWHMAAPCAAWLKAAWIDWIGAEKLWELYGGSEAFGATVVRGDEWLSKPGTVGRPGVAGLMRTVNEDGAVCAAGEIGEIQCLVDPNAEPSHYIGAQAKRAPGGWVTYGDMGYLDEDGYLFIADRRTDMILRGGANIFPAEVEAALDEHPSVGSSVVISVPCDDLGHRVHAIVQPRQGERLEIDDLHAFLVERLVSYKLPESYEFADQPLRDDAGKVRRSALRDERAIWMREGRKFQLRPRDSLSHPRRGAKTK
jgi:bile acid-coenzyme A ligase